jgi:hypothetical protein
MSHGHPASSPGPTRRVCRVGPGGTCYTPTALCRHNATAFDQRRGQRYRPTRTSPSRITRLTIRARGLAIRVDMASQHKLSPRAQPDATASPAPRVGANDVGRTIALFLQV